MDLQNWDFLRLENRVEKLNRVRVATLTRSLPVRSAHATMRPVLCVWASDTALSSFEFVFTHYTLVLISS